MSPESEKYAGIRRLLLVLAGICGLVGLLVEYGTYPGPWELGVARTLSTAAVILFLVEQRLSAMAAGTFRAYLRRRWPTFVLSSLLALEALVLTLGSRTIWLKQILSALHLDSLTSAYLIMLQLYLVAIFVVELPHLHARLSGLRMRPAFGFVGVFAALILAGAGLLLLPRATPLAQPIGMLDALFTSTSAVCVTGLVVRDTGSGFTLFGQSVILVLIQLGGLGIMSLTVTLSLLLGRGIGVRENSLLREVFQIPMLSEAGRVVRKIVLMTLIFEAVGTAVLYAGFAGVPDLPGPRLFTAAFHSVSAFCNAGFGTFSDSLMSFAEKPLVMVPIAVLIIVGGIGFGVVVQIVAWARGRATQRHGRGYRLGLNARVVLAMTAILLAGGCGFLAFFEWRGSLAGESVALKLGQSFFQSVTCRTAGFNSMDLSLLTPASLLIIIGLMFVGGAPGSTAGGIKVTSVAIAWANLHSIIKGRSRLRLGDREIDAVDVQRALLVVTAAGSAASVGVLVLLVSEGRDLMVTAFEVFSALGTVGLSLGMTPSLSVTGRVVVILLMFMGRLGPLTLAGSLTSVGHEPQVRVPRGRILIG